MKILDIFCGQGIAARGLQEFGDVTGFDIDETCEKYYPGTFVKSDWKNAAFKNFDFIWASPPCHQYSSATAPARKLLGKKYPDLLKEVILTLQKTGKPFVVENVPTAPFDQSFFLCGQMFNLNLKRHRKFYANFFVMRPPHPKHKFGVTKVWGNGQHKGENKALWLKAMGVRDSNCTKRGLALGVPVPYVRWIMKQYLMWNKPRKRLVEDVIVEV